MTSINVFNGEKFEKNSLRYIIFATVFVGIILMSIFTGNFVGAVVMFFLLGGYLYYTLTINQIIKIRIENGILYVGEKNIPWSNYIGFVIEIELKSNSIKNIVLVGDRSHNIFTIDDEIKNVGIFLDTLVNYIPHLDNYDQSAFEKLSRRLKL